MTPATARRHRTLKRRATAMAGETQITVVGNLTAEPELRFTSGGKAVANFTVASTPRTFDRQANEWRDGEALFLRCTVWQQPAENVAESLHKGQRVIVVGSLKQRSFENREGQKRSVIELDVEEVGPSLRFATVSVQKAQRGSAPQRNDSRPPVAASAAPSAPPADDPWSAPAGGGFSEQPPF